jgi:hypothetical protein
VQRTRRRQLILHNTGGKAFAQATAATPTSCWANQNEECHEAPSSLAQRGTAPGREARRGRRHGNRSAPTKPSKRELTSADAIFVDRSARDFHPEQTAQRMEVHTDAFKKVSGAGGVTVVCPIKGRLSFRPEPHASEAPPHRTTVLGRPQGVEVPSSDRRLGPGLTNATPRDARVARVNPAGRLPAYVEEPRGSTRGAAGANPAGRLGHGAAAASARSPHAMARGRWTSARPPARRGLAARRTGSCATRGAARANPAVAGPSSHSGIRPQPLHEAR